MPPETENKAESTWEDEFRALRQAVEALSSRDEETRDRMLTYLLSRFGSQRLKNNLGVA